MILQVSWNQMITFLLFISSIINHFLQCIVFAPMVLSSLSGKAYFSFKLWISCVKLAYFSSTLHICSSCEFPLYSIRSLALSEQITRWIGVRWTRWFSTYGKSNESFSFKHTSSMNEDEMENTWSTSETEQTRAEERMAVSTVKHCSLKDFPNTNTCFYLQDTPESTYQSQ